MKNYNDIPPNYKISMPMVYNHAMRVLTKLDRRLNRLNSPALPIKYKYEINRLAHKLEQMVAKYKQCENKLKTDLQKRKDL